MHEKIYYVKPDIAEGVKHLTHLQALDLEADDLKKQFEAIVKLKGEYEEVLQRLEQKMKAIVLRQRAVSIEIKLERQNEANVTKSEEVEVPKIKLPGSDAHWNAYDLGQELERAFPNNDAHDFCYAVAHNNLPEGIPVDTAITALRLLQQGENDGESWIWLVKFDSYGAWQAVGSCDYTGWDCQSGLDWTKLEDNVEG